jgi:hypothetical protein
VTGRAKLTAAEREARGEVGFMNGDRAARDTARKQHVADAIQELRKSARISAASKARRRSMQLRIADYALRRRERIKMRRELVAEFDAALAPLLAWFERVES